MVAGLLTARLALRREQSGAQSRAAAAAHALLTSTTAAMADEKPKVSSEGFLLVFYNAVDRVRYVIEPSVFAYQGFKIRWLYLKPSGTSPNIVRRI